MGPNKKFQLTNLKKNYVEKHRPGHFEAIVDVIERFIKDNKSKEIYFGEKDMQQLKIIKDFVNKKNILK